MKQLNQLSVRYKSIFLLSIFFFFFYFTADSQRIKGSDTLLPLTQQLAEAFAQKNPGIEISVTGGGSGVGIAALQEGSTDLTMSSRALKTEERDRLRKVNRQVSEVIVAYDALAVVVNPQNPVSKLTRLQLQEIFHGKIRNWKEVGGNNQPIIVYTRESSSGTYEFFLEKVLDYHNFTPRALSMGATGIIIESLKHTLGGIAYVGYSYIDHLKPIAVSFKGTYYLPTSTNIHAGLYPIVRPLYYYYQTKEKARIQPFIDFIHSQEGEALISKLGYIPLLNN